MPEKRSGLVPVFMPALVMLLLDAERSKGSPLTEAEVHAIRDQAAVILLPARIAQQMPEKRGYGDLDPEHAWEEWQIVREVINPPDDPA